MLTLQQALQDRDLGYLQIVAEFWGLELTGVTARQAHLELARAMLQPDLVREVVETLPAEARAALDLLLAHGGQAPAAQFARDSGVIRPMGPGRRDREMPWLDPISPAEVLWYHGLVSRAFADADRTSTAAATPQEFIFVPEDLRGLLPVPAAAPAGAAPGEALGLAADAQYIRASTSLVDDAATVLAAFRRASRFDSQRLAREVQPFLLTGNQEATREEGEWGREESAFAGEILAMLMVLLIDSGCARADGLELVPAVARPFLERPRGEQLAALFQTWRGSPTWNDLRQIPGLICEGNWQNDPIPVRKTVLGFLKLVPAQTWWSLESFVAAIKERQPDFQRPAGNYDSWYLRDSESGDYLRGFEHWDQVDGALIRYLITGPLHWLGVTDLHFSRFRSPISNSRYSDFYLPGSAERERSGKESTAFRVTSWGQALLAGESPQITEPAGQLRVLLDGRLTVDRAVSRYERFQAARLTEWVGVDRARFTYRFSPKSLAQAQEQGVQVRHILAFLSRAASNPIPPSLIEALARWEKHGAEASASDMLVLKLKSPGVLESLRNSPEVGRYLGDDLGPAAVEIKRSDWEKLRAALARMGMLMD